MKKLLFTVIVALFAISVSAQNDNKVAASASPYYTHECYNKKLVKTAKQWLKKGEWRHGFTKADPHYSVNAVDFYLQYQKDPESWSKMFEFLQETDILSLPKGSVDIPGTKLKLSVQDAENSPLEKRKSESHYHGIDFQWCVKGTERFGILDHVTSTSNCKYDAKKDMAHYDYDKSRTRFYDSAPDKFFIFFPGDWHIAKVATDTKDQHIRVVVVKVKWVE